MSSRYGQLHETQPENTETAIVQNRQFVSHYATVCENYFTDGKNR